MTITVVKDSNAVQEKRFIEIPDDIEAKLLGQNHIQIKGPKGTLDRKFERVSAQITIEDGKIYIFDYYVNRHSKAVVGTISAHIKNMLKGVQKPYVYKLKIIYSHFPITVKVIGKEVEYTGLYGQRAKKRVPIVGQTKVKVEGEDIVVEGINLEDVSQTAFNIEQSTRLRGQRAKDPRIFQDGIYVYEKIKD